MDEWNTSWFQVFRLACSRILEMFADANPGAKNEARRAAYVFGDLDGEGYGSVIGDLIELSDECSRSLDRGEAELTEVVPQLHDPMMECLKEYGKSGLDDSFWVPWSQFWEALDVEAIVEYMKNERREQTTGPSNTHL